MPRMILLFGYWPPTDCGVPERPGMLQKWRTVQTITHDGKTFDVLAMSPRFNAPLGHTQGNDQEPFWGRGESDSGSFTVDYRDTSEKFWNIVTEHSPIAIMSFSRWAFDNHWFLDEWGTNWTNDAWTTELSFIDSLDRPWQMNWPPPYVGGSPPDPAPPSKGQISTDGNGPDSTKSSTGTLSPGVLPPVDARRFNNLPMQEIKAAIANSLPSDRINPDINSVKGPGQFVSNFLAYHVMWYRDWWKTANDDPERACLMSGHTHVGGQVTVDDAERAVEIQLEELFKVLPS